MVGLSRSISLPVVLVLFLSAEECDEGPDPRVEVQEKIAVSEGSALEVALTYRSDSMAWLLDGDPIPRAELGWDSVHLRRSGVKGYALHAWNHYAPGERLHGSFADEGDPFLLWYVRSSSRVGREERGDTVHFTFRREYPAHGWMPMGLFHELLEEKESLYAMEDSLNSLDFPEWRVFERKWGDEDHLELLEETTDTVRMMEYLEDLRGAMEVGNPSLLEIQRRRYELDTALDYLSEEAWILPAVRSVVGGRVPGCWEKARERVLASVDVVEITPEEAFWLYMTDPTNPPEWLMPEATPDLEGEVERLLAETHREITGLLLSECGFAAAEFIEIERRFRWLCRRYPIEHGQLESRSHGIMLSLPGELTYTNADTVVDGKAQWRFGVGNLVNEPVVLLAESMVVRRWGNPTDRQIRGYRRDPPSRSP